MMSRKYGRELNVNPVLAGVLVAISLGCLAYLITVGWDVLFPRSIHDARMDASCDLSTGPCTARFGDGSEIALAINPSIPIANQPVRLTVEVTGQAPEDVNVSLTGARMNMGVINAPLLDIGHGYFAGDTSLPMCVRKSMTWSAKVISDSSRGRYQAAFEFDMLSHLETARQGNPGLVNSRQR